jgi:dipeptidyl aminopeptidase/acylaminoacyl peptidase
MRIPSSRRPTWRKRCLVATLRFLLLGGCISLASTSGGTEAPGTRGSQSSEVAVPVDEMRARYERAAGWQDHDARHYVLNADVSPTWLEGADAFWYRRQTVAGGEYVIFDAARATRKPAFDHGRLAAQLSVATGKGVAAGSLPLADLEFTAKATVARFSAFGRRWYYDIRKGSLAEEAGTIPDPGAVQVSPDGKRALLVRDSNLWLRNLETGREFALTTDGTAHDAYASLPDLPIAKPPLPEALWSPDSTRILTVRLDEQQVLDMPHVDLAPVNGGLRPTARMVKTALPGDPHVPQYHMLVIDAESGKQVPAQYPAIVAGRMYETPPGSGRAWWSADGKTAYFVELERGERTARVIAMDAASGATHVVFEEKAPHYIELGSKLHFRPALLPVPGSDELIWYSERSGWAHLYLYDLRTGALKRQLTSGEWLVRDVLAVDAPRREVWFTRAGVVPGRNPYYRELARVNLDSGAISVVSASDADHRLHSIHERGSLMPRAGRERLAGVSPSGSFVVETLTRADGPPRTQLLRHDGTVVATIESADASRVPSGWNWPESFVGKGADGTTDIAALVFRPSDFSPEHRYPMIDCVYGGPHVSHLPTIYGGALCYFDAASLAELGFVVTMIAGRGTAERSRAFHETSYGAVETASNLEDHIAVIRQLAARYPYLDPERVGITGFSAGGYMAAIGMLKFPDFFKVGVAASGNYDQRLFVFPWGERYQGLVDGENYVSQAAATYAGALKGKLMFIHGLADPGVHPAGLLQLTQALIDAGKDFDLTLQPRAGHEIGGWAQRRQWDYFVRHLAGLEPPPPVAHKSGDDLASEAP